MRGDTLNASGRMAGPDPEPKAGAGLAGRGRRSRGLLANRASLEW